MHKDPVVVEFDTTFKIKPIKNKAASNDIHIEEIDVICFFVHYIVLNLINKDTRYIMGEQVEKNNIL